jgi:hypothetical protein
MPLKDLDDDQRESLMRASDLIRAAGWEKKAQTIQDFLAKRNQIFVDPDMDSTHAAETKAYHSPPTITFNPNISLKKENPSRPLEKSDPGFIVLAGILVHEADHAHFHGEIEAYGDELEFLHQINEEFDKFFPGQPADTAKGVKDKKHEWEQAAEIHRKQYIRDADKKEKSSGDHKMPERLPDAPRSAAERAMTKWARLILEYCAEFGSCPRGGNRSLVKQLREWRPDAIRPKDVNERGEIVDGSGRPYVYRAPGRIYPDRFDLISTNNPKIGVEFGRDDRLCLLNRR